MPYWKQAYLDYLQSPQWQEMRRKYLGVRCEMCGSTKRLQLNHRTYKNLYHETAADFSTLCHNCHTYVSIDPATGKKRKDSLELAERLLRKARSRNPVVAFLWEIWWHVVGK